MDIYNKFIYFCYQLDNAIGKGNLIDSCFSNNCYTIDNLTLSEIRDGLIKLSYECLNASYISKYEKIYLCKHIEALKMQIKIKLEKCNYIEAISVLYDIDAQAPNHKNIEKLHSELDYLLSECGYNCGTLGQRVDKWSKDNKVNANEFINLAIKKSKEYVLLVQEKIGAFVDFNCINDVLDLKLVSTNEGWAAYNYYLKNYTGIIEFNSSSDFNRYSLNSFISHEGYPGHHTSCMIKEYLYRTNPPAYLEKSSDFIHTIMHRVKR
ncbi:MAG: hypothetical protein K2G88_03950 [Oscillospiraceae bacterium]|nr:hypothetical protein [Oscillospiraceae bacterium]